MRTFLQVIQSRENLLDAAIILFKFQIIFIFDEFSINVTFSRQSVNDVFSSERNLKEVRFEILLFTKNMMTVDSKIMSLFFFRLDDFVIHVFDIDKHSDFCHTVEKHTSSSNIFAWIKIDRSELVLISFTENTRLQNFDNDIVVNSYAEFENFDRVLKFWIDEQWINIIDRVIVDTCFKKDEIWQRHLLLIDRVSRCTELRKIFDEDFHFSRQKFRICRWSSVDCQRF